MSMNASQAPVTLDNNVTLSDQVMMQEVGGEAVLLDLFSEQYFGLDPVGTRIWALLAESAQLRAVHVRLCEEFDADADLIAADLIALTQALAGAGLVKVD